MTERMTKPGGWCLVLLLAAGCDGTGTPADAGSDIDGLDPLMEIDSGAWNVWTRECSQAGEQVPRPMFVRQPAEPGTYPVFVFLPGTTRRSDNPSALRMIEEVALRGFVAVSVDYDSTAGVFEEDVCATLVGKAHCTFSVDREDAPEAALHLVCNNVDVDGNEAGLKADCDKGVIVAGFSQGGMIALLSQDHHPEVVAAWGLGHHDQGIIDEQPAACLHHSNRVLPADRSRIIIGESDTVMQGPHAPRLADLTGRVCDDGAAQCFDEADGSGWGIVPDEACAEQCIHEYLDEDVFWETSEWWGAAHNLDWLTGHVDG